MREVWERIEAVLQVIAPDRLAGLAASHDLLARNEWKGVEAADLVRSQLAHLGALVGTRVKFEGPPLRLKASAEQALGMALHELVTNAVKHFKFEQRGKRRLHKHPNRYEVERCRWWLDLELRLVAPKLVVALGAIAARELLGRPVTLAKERGQLLRLADGRPATAAVHPSAVLRMRDNAERRAAFEAFVDDLRRARQMAESLSKTDG